MSKSVTHDYTKTSWGHNISFITVSEDGNSAVVVGHGYGVKKGDYLLLANGSSSTTRYRVEEWRQARPADCWRAHIVFDPRQKAAVSPVEKSEQV